MKPPANKESILAKFKEGPALLEHAINGLRDVDLDFPPKKGGWTIRQIVHHIADGDDVWKLCIKIALGNEQAEFKLDWYSKLSQMEWSEKWAYSSRSIKESLNLLKASRENILQIISHVPDAWSKSAEFRSQGGKVERISVGFIINMQTDHLVQHVEKINSIRKKIGVV
jgi:uncharacterized damage-inducible protein DinB